MQLYNTSRFKTFSLVFEMLLQEVCEIVGGVLIKSFQPPLFELAYFKPLKRPPALAQEFEDNKICKFC